MMHDEASSTILIIDDNCEHLHTLERILKEQGYCVQLASGSNLGLASARRDPPDTILIDSVMGDMGGYDVCRQLKQEPALADIPVIFISALDQTTDKVKAFAVGGVDYLTRPFQAEEVLARVATHLTLRRIQQQFQQQNIQLQQEIAERQRAEAGLRRVERALRALSQCNTSLLHASDETELLSTICQIIVDRGGYRLAWVGFAEHDTARTVRPVTWAGDEDGYLATLHITWDDTERGKGPTGTAIRTGIPRIVTNMAHCSEFQPWRSQAHQRGYASSIALPLIHDGITLGTLNVYASELDAFDAEEVTLLMQLANNLAYGIGSLRHRVARERAEAALRENEVLLQAFLDHSPTLVFVRDLHGRFLMANHAYEAMVARTHEHIIGKTPYDILPADIAERFCDHDHEVVATRQPIIREEVVSQHNGVHIYLSNKFPLYDAQGRMTAVGGISTDITERKQVEEKMTQRNQELAVINQITEAVSRCLALSDIVETLQGLLIDRLGMSAGAISLYHEVDDSLSQEVVWGIIPTGDETDTLLNAATAYNRRVVREQRPLVIPIMHHTLQPEAHQADTAPDDAWSYLGVPILAQGQLQGVLDLFKTPPTSFSQDQITFFATLGQQVGTAIQNARLFAEVQSARERLQTLSHRLVEVQELERRTIARELHDEVGQILTGLNLSLEMVARLPVDQVYSRIEHALELLNDLMRRVREMSMELRPPMLDDLGLLPALVWHFERYTEHTGIAVIFKHTGIEQRFAPQIEITVYRFIQEALTNVARYAGVADVEVRIWVHQDELGVQVEDQGCGFDPEAALMAGSTSGLSGMRERVRLLGGELQIEAIVGQGSCLIIELPLRKPSDSASLSHLLYAVEEKH